MTTPTSRNRLDEEESPYLRQHADNPVNWQPWDEDALATAREHDVPIFLSIGYAACHWCHVMEEESFQNEAIAEVLNEQFVPIKVDREERPDLDSVYMSICQAVTGRGGWPLSVFLTPEGKPFYVGTYFPPEEKRGQPGFHQLLGDIVASWNDPDERADVEDRAEEWTRAVTEDLESVPDQPGSTPDDDLLASAASAAVRGADREEGGWGPGPKFPHPGRLHLLMRASERTGRSGFRAVATETLDAMAEGGMYDQLGGGFHRYATDSTWTVPHFEKMLYDNAELTRAYLAGYQLTGEERYARVAHETLAFVEDELTHPDGGFYSTLDARSETVDGEIHERETHVENGDEGETHVENGHEGETHVENGHEGEDHEGEGHVGEMAEGAFYVWTPDQVATAVETHGDGDLDADLATTVFRDRYDVTEAGNFEGATVLTRAQPVDAVADEHDLSVGETESLLASAEDAVLAARAERPRPSRDEKVLAGWNGLMISAFAEAEIVLDSGCVDRATAALEFLQEHLWDEDAGRLHRRYKDGDVRIPGYLEDYAFLGRGALDVYQATGDVDHLAFALDLARAVVAEFWDADEETLYFTPTSGEDLIARPQELDDSSTPSSAGVAADLLASLQHFTPRDDFGEIAEAVVRTHGAKLAADPLRHASLTLATDVIQNGSLELTIAAEEPPADWLDAIGERYLPTRLLAPRPPTESDLDEWLARLGIEEAPPIWADRSVRDDEPTVYACRSFACSPPLGNVEEALEWADSNLREK